MTLAEPLTRPADRAATRVLRVYGMRRSGNHAVIDWIMRNAPEGQGLFLNNCKPGRDPVRSARGRSRYKKGTPRNLPRKPDGPAPFTLVSFEDHMPPVQRDPLWDGTFETCVIIHRSFLNWAASLVRKIQGNPGYGPIDRNRVMAGALAGYRTMLDRLGTPGIQALDYDRWTASQDYRAEALGRLDLPGTDLSQGAVQRYGGGSSFQGKADSPEDLSTDKRAAQMADDLEYQLVLWTAARDTDFLRALAGHYPADATRLSDMLDTASAAIRLPDTQA